MISGFERFRAGQFGIRHYCTIGLNPKEANNEALAEAVIDALPRFLAKEGVVAMGELGYDEQTAAEDKALRAQIELAKEFDLPIMIHTPHRDKRPGTLRTMDVLKEHGFDPTRCVIDHNNEETIREVRDRGYWCAFSIYPNTKMGSERMAALVKSYGPERLIVDSACDWGVSDPLAVAKTARLMAETGRRGGGHPPGRLCKRARGLRPEHRDEGRPLAGAIRHRSANALRGQFGIARRPDAAHRRSGTVGRQTGDYVRRRACATTNVNANARGLPRTTAYSTGLSNTSGHQRR